MKKWDYLQWVMCVYVKKSINISIKSFFATIFFYLCTIYSMNIIHSRMKWKTQEKHKIILNSNSLRIESAIRYEYFLYTCIHINLIKVRREKKRNDWVLCIKCNKSEHNQFSFSSLILFSRLNLFSESTHFI